MISHLQSATRAVHAAVILAVLLLIQCEMAAQSPPWQCAVASESTFPVGFAFFDQDPDYVWGVGLYESSVSTDGGLTWDSISYARDNTGSVALDPFDRNRILSGYSAAGTKTIALSTDGGGTWRYGFWGPGGNHTVIAVHPSVRRTVFAGAGWAYLLRTTDFGEHWDTLARPTPGEYICDLSICRDVPEVMYLATNRAIHRTSDGGLTWHNGGTPPVVFSTLAKVAAHPRDPNRAYVGIWSPGNFPGGVYATTDGGVTWTEKNNGLPPTDWEIWFLAIDPVHADTIYALLGNEERRHILFRTRNSGESWEPFDNGLPVCGGSAAYRLGIHPSGRRLLVSAACVPDSSGPAESGVFYLDLVNSVADPAAQRSSRGSLACFPSPAGGVLELQYTLEEAGKVKAVLFNVLGQPVRAQDLGVQGAGSQTGRLDVRDLPSGLYVLRLSAGVATYHQRVVVAR